MEQKVELNKLIELVEKHDEEKCSIDHCDTCQEIKKLRSATFSDGKYFINDMQSSKIIKFDKRKDIADFLGVKDYIVNNMLSRGMCAMGYTADYVIRQ